MILTPAKDPQEVLENPCTINIWYQLILFRNIVQFLNNGNGKGKGKGYWHTEIGDLFISFN